MRRLDKWWAWVGLALLCFLALPLQTNFGWLIRAGLTTILIFIGLKISRIIDRKIDEQVELKRRVDVLEETVRRLNLERRVSGADPSFLGVDSL